MTSNVIPLNITMRDEYSPSDRAEIMGRVFMDTSQIINACNDRLDRVLANTHEAINNKGKQ